MVFKKEIMHSGCRCILMHTHLETEKWFPCKDIFLMSEMWSTRECSFKLNSNLHAIFCFNFATTPGGTWETSHLCLTHLNNRLAVTASNPCPVLEHVDPACNTRHSVKSRCKKLLALGFGSPSYPFVLPVRSPSMLMYRCSTSTWSFISLPFSKIPASTSATSLYTKKGNICSVPNVKTW